MRQASIRTLLEINACTKFLWRTEKILHYYAWIYQSKIFRDYKCSKGMLIVIVLVTKVNILLMLLVTRYSLMDAIAFLLMLLIWLMLLVTRYSLMDAIAFLLMLLILLMLLVTRYSLMDAIAFFLVLAFKRRKEEDKHTTARVS